MDVVVEHSAERELVAPVSLVVDLVAWVAARPRSYVETMEAWRTSCPRLPVWEDALSSGFVAVEWDEGAGEPKVVVTPEGHAFVARRAMRSSA